MRTLTDAVRRTLGGAALVAALLAAGVAMAHHGWGSYDAERPMTLTGPLTEVTIEQPHVSVMINADGRTWTVVLAPISRMQSRGATPDMLQVGTTVSAYGYPIRSGAAELRAERITIDGRTYELR